MDDANILAQLLSDTAESPNPLWVNDMFRRHPAFILPALLLIKRCPDAVDAQTLQKLQSAVAVNCPDRTALIDYIDIDGRGWADIYPPSTQASLSTEQAIDDFISVYCKSATPDEEAVLERLIMNPVPADYFVETDEPYDPQDPLALPPELMRHDDDEKITEETHKSHRQSPEIHDKPLDKNKKPEKAIVRAEDTLLMESLAKIFIKQQRYERAYEIISKLSLNYPEKSVYFADQLRFLQKLMINQRHTTDKNIKKQL